MSGIFKHEFNNGTSIRLNFIHEKIVRITISPSGREFEDSGLNKYGFINENLGGAGAVRETSEKNGFALESGDLSIKVDVKNGSITFFDSNGKELVSHTAREFNGKYAQAEFLAGKDEDWVGFGDQTRERLYHRGHVADCIVTDINSYIPVPFFMSTRGYGIMDNTVHRTVFDMCKTHADKFFWRDFGGTIDFYFFSGKSFQEILGLYTELTGKPKLPPAWSFGLWYICRMQANDYEVVNDALNFRREEIPCDVIGLEPGWMETEYDLSVDKKWNSKLFPIPAWAPNGPHTFISALKRMGFKLDLWLCNEYDLLFEEDRRIKGIKQTDDSAVSANETLEGGELDEHVTDPKHWERIGEPDQHLACPRYLDQITQKDEPWFEHLKKFVDQGADFFKQDGAFQVLHHPDRVWGKGLRDEDVHNLYPLFYSRQMHEGFQRHTNRRPVVFTVAGWAGFQAWCGTWTGDTGGRIDTLGGMLNTSLVGHSWTTNDMEVMQKEGIHFGYLQPWSQINSWASFRMPWLQGRELLEMHRYYGQLRSRLFPYLYSWAYQATKSAVPLLLPLTLEFQDDPACRNILHEYLLGRDLLVVIYKEEAYFPTGGWKDFWTGEVFQGLERRKIQWPINRGGGLFVREGAIIPFGPVMQYRGEKPMDEINLYVFPSRTPSEFELYEDDGVSLEHLDGNFAITKIKAHKTQDEIVVEIGEPKGNFQGKIEERVWNLTIAVETKPAKAYFKEEEITCKVNWDENRNELSINGLRGNGVLKLTC
jgi:alpha-glucosidase (family GH31 glycosyl hydrolase)